MCVCMRVCTCGQRVGVCEAHTCHTHLFSNSLVVGVNTCLSLTLTLTFIFEERSRRDRGGGGGGGEVYERETERERDSLRERVRGEGRTVAEPVLASRAQDFMPV